jgi:carboxyl-terminal processing protease
MKTKTKIIFIAGSAFVLASVFALGMYIGFAHRPYVTRVSGVIDKEVPIGETADFEPFWKVWSLIDQEHPGADKITSQQRVYGAIKGLVSSLDDPYSVYFPPQDSKDFHDTISGSFEGIGMEVGIKDKLLTVIAPLKDTPSEKAGIKAGDKIIKIDTTSTNDMSVDKAVELIRGVAGTVVKLTIFREGEAKPREIAVTRDVISIPTLEAKLRPDGVYDIQLYNFSANSAGLMTDALHTFAKSGSTKLIIDLRGNPGGYLDSAVDIASYFLPEGDTIVQEDFGTNGSPRVYRSKGYELLNLKKIKVALLVDRGSASASEILAGALSEHGVAPLIGETTYGKGSVQKVIDVTDTTTLKLTIAKWLTPNGVSISLKGLTPTIPVAVTDQDITNKVDPVLNRALQYFKDGK